MPKKKSALLQRVSRLLKIFIFLENLKKPIIPMLVCLKKTRKLKKIKLLKNYSHYCYVKEYEFSPSSTPLILFYSKPQNERVSFRKLYANFYFISKCLGMARGGRGKERCCVEMGLEPLPCKTENAVSREWMMDLWDYSCSEDDSVDERAERFIQRFHEEMRRQRLESHLQLNSMLEI
ncbi:hypothetical protein Pfo_023733 [Paulownia fortunei]|nr:hypothetical protein Pfo_023733 [Paulownia fortunei]